MVEIVKNFIAECRQEYGLTRDSTKHLLIHCAGRNTVATILCIVGVFFIVTPFISAPGINAMTEKITTPGMIIIGVVLIVAGNAVSQAGRVAYRTLRGTCCTTTTGEVITGGGDLFNG
jgi:hypothetical protein